MGPAVVGMVVFDLGGVLVRICRSWPEACARVGLDLRAGWDDPAKREIRGRLSHEYHLGMLGTDEFCERLAGTTPGSYSPQEVRRVHDAWLIEEYEGVSTLIDDLHAAGIVTGVLSNTNEAHWERLAGGPDRAPEFVAPGKVRHLHASHLLRAAKPSVDCFRAFESRCGPALIGNGVIFFDDLPENIEGAERAGWKGRLVDHTGDTATQMREFLRADGIW
jgi:FMN phosphatase YigB (HAD superfamily)